MLQLKYMKNIFKKLSLLTIVAIITFALFSNAPIVKAVVANKIPTPIALYEDSLASAINSTATSFSLVRGTDVVGTSLAASTYGFIIDEGSATQEFVIADCTATACTNAIRGVSPITGLTTVTSLEKSHRRGATVKMTDAPILLILKRLLNGDETLPNILSYVSHPTFSSNTQIVDKQYVDESASAGCGNADTSTKGCVEVATQAEVDAGTQLGGSGAYLATNPATTRAKKYHDYAADSVGTDSYAITVSPTISAYSAGQVFTFKAGTANTGAASLNVSALGAKTIYKNVSTDLETGDILANQIVTVIYDGTNMQLQSKTSKTYLANGVYSFGGDGSDGVLNVTSGTTTVDLGNAAIFTKNYSSINVSAGATLTFSNPNSKGTIIQLKSSGNVIIAGTINASGMGATGGEEVAGNGLNPNGVLGTESQFGTNGIKSGAVGAAGTAATLVPLYAYNNFTITSKFVNLIPGAGGGGGSHGCTDGTNCTGTSLAGGAGGNGGGAVYIECAGALTFTGTINTSGANGSNGTSAGSIAFTGSGSGAGGGGGAAGMQVIIYNTLTTNSGTMTASGGSGGSGGSVTSGSGGSGVTSGGGAASLTSSGTIGVGMNTNGTNASGTGSGGSGGGGRSSNGVAQTGGSGSGSMGGIVIKNTMFD
jgi:hypothetical protein